MYKRQDNVGSQSLGEFERADAVSGLTNDLVVVAAQNAAQQGSRQLVVVDDQYFRSC